MYNCLPMYHSIGGVVAVWAMLLAGGSVVIRERFSSGRFWKDVVAFDCTLFQYIGELCRYLINAPPGAEEKRHRLRLCVGNGLRPDVWSAFQRRFAIPRILEFYAATESNFSLYNVEGEPGAIGRVPPFMAHRFHVEIVKCDFEREEALRDAAGRCIRCEADEVGEAIAAIEPNARDGSSNFEGYLNRADSQKKVLRDVFAPGDAWMRSGDLMRKDARGFSTSWIASGRPFAGRARMSRRPRSRRRSRLFPASSRRTSMAFGRRLRRARRDGGSRRRRAVRSAGFDASHR